MELDEAALRQQLLCLKAKSYQVKWTGGADATQGAPARDALSTPRGTCAAARMRESSSRALHVCFACRRAGERV